MNRKVLPVLFVVFLLAISSIAQAPPGNLLEKTELTFVLSGEPTLQDAGLDNPKSSWKLKYELYLTDFSELEKIGICRKDDAGRHICQRLLEKKDNKRIRKISSKLTAGNYSRRSLQNEAEREIKIPVNLPPKVIEIFNQAVKAPEKNPTFVLFVAEKISAKNSTGAKLKSKYSTTGIKNLKNARSNQDFDYWDVSRLSKSSSIIKQENGRLVFAGSAINYGGLNN